MTSNDPRMDEPESATPTPRGPTCRIIYRTPNPLTTEDAIRIMVSTTAVVAFAASTIEFPAEQLPSERTYSVDQWAVYWYPFWRRGDQGLPSGEDQLAAIMPVGRLTYSSPFEILLGTPEHYAAAAAAALLVIPTIVARFSRLRARLARDSLEQEVYDALRKEVERDARLARLDDHALDGLLRIERAVTEDTDKTVDSETLNVDHLDDS